MGRKGGVSIYVYIHIYIAYGLLILHGTNTPSLVFCSYSLRMYRALSTPCAERVFEQMKEELSDATLRYETCFVLRLSIIG